MYISPISQVRQSKLQFKAVSINNKFISTAEANNLVSEFSKKLQSIDTKNNKCEGIFNYARVVTEKLEKQCEAEKDKVKVSVSEKGFFETEKHYYKRLHAASDEEESQKEKIKSSYRYKIGEVEAKEKNEISDIVAKSKIVLKESDEYLNNINILVQANDRSDNIQRRKKHEDYYSGRSVFLKDKGFDRIAGYEEEKEILYKYFINEIKKEKNGENANVPGSVLFFGPRGMGKTRFYKAFAEEAECRTIEIFTSNQSKNYNKILNKIIKKAEEAEKVFEDTKTRSIIFIDELTNLVSEKSSILNELSEFLSTCSEKYHCTVFAATNYPEKIAIPLSDNQDLFPVRVLLDPPTREDKSAILKFYLRERMPENTNFDELVSLIEQKEQDDGNLYSINLIKTICCDPQMDCKKLSKEEFIDMLSMTPANITKGQLDKYNESYKNLIVNIIKGE